MAPQPFAVVETEAQRLAREITVMNSCGGVLNRTDWAGHVGKRLEVIASISEVELDAVAELVSGSRQEARSFLLGLSVQCASLAANFDSPVWRRESRVRHLLDDSLEVVALLWQVPKATRDASTAVKAHRAPAPS